MPAACLFDCAEQMLCFCNREDIIRRIDAETQVQLEQMNKSVASTTEKVITELLDMVVEDVKPELHRNLRLG